MSSSNPPNTSETYFLMWTLAREVVLYLFLQRWQCFICSWLTPSLGVRYFGRSPCPSNTKDGALVQR